MSTRFRSSRPSNKGRLLRPRSERAPRVSSAPPEAVTEESIGSTALDVSASQSVAIEEAPESEVVSVVPAQPVSGERLVAAEVPPPPSEPVAPVAAAEVSFESEAPPSMPLGTPRELSAAAVSEQASIEPLQEPVEVAPAMTEEPPAVSVPVSEASAPEGSVKKKKKKKKDKDKDGKKVEARSSPEAPALAASAPAAVPSLTSKLESSSSTHEKLSTSGSHDKLTKSSGHHSKLNESGRHRALVEDDESADQFFSIAPPAVAEVEEPLEDLAPPPVQRSPEAIERQKKARKIVGAVVAVAALVVLLGVGRMLFGGKPADAQPRGVTTQAQRPASETAAPTTATETAAAVAVPAPSPEPVAEATATAEASASAVESASASASAEASAEASASSAEPGSMTPEQLKELRRKVEILANKGDNPGAIEAAKTYLAADPTDSYIHLHLGNAYMNMGKMKDAREAFNECVRKGKGGYIHECARWGGKK